MPTERLYLVGAGGHCKVVLDALMGCGVQRERIVILDDDTTLHGNDFMGCAIDARSDRSIVSGRLFHVAVGAGRTREQLTGEYERAGGTPVKVIHPTAAVSELASIAVGSFVAAHAVVAPLAQVSPGAIVNHGAIVDHDCVVGSYAHVAPNATLGGGVRVGARVMVGAGATILPGISIGEDAVIGAGAVVVRDVPARATWVGVPAVEIKRPT